MRVGAVGEGGKGQTYRSSSIGVAALESLIQRTHA